MLAWLGKGILNLIGGPIVKGVVDAYKAKLEAGNTRDALAADLAGRELAVEQRERELHTQLLIAEQGNWITRWVRPLWAMPFVIFTWKVIVFDKVLGWGVTDELTGWTATLGVTVAAAYFGGRSIEKVASIFAKRK